MPYSRKIHNKLVALYANYKKDCVKNKVLHRDYADWFEYYNINELLKTMEK